MYYLNKIVWFLSNPISVTVLAGAVALACAYTGRRKIAKWIGIGAVVWLWMWATPLMGRIVGATLEREFLADGWVPKVETFPNADAIVLLGGSMAIQTNMSHYAEMWTSADRVWQAARLYKAGKAPKILATSGWVKLTTFPLLRDFGVPDEALVFVDDAKNTEEEAKSIAKLGVKKILLVTSAWHMKRARLMFEKYAPKVEVVCAPADFENSRAAAEDFSLGELWPNEFTLGANCASFHEWIGIIGYTLLR